MIHTNTVKFDTPKRKQNKQNKYLLRLLFLELYRTKTNVSVKSKLHKST